MRGGILSRSAHGRAVGLQRQLSLRSSPPLLAFGVAGGENVKISAETLDAASGILSRAQRQHRMALRSWHIAAAYYGGIGEPQQQWQQAP